MGWPLLWGVQLVTDAQLEAGAQVKKLEKELRLEKDMHLSTTLLVSRPVDQLGELDNKLETLVCHFAS